MKMPTSFGVPTWFCPRDIAQEIARIPRSILAGISPKHPQFDATVFIPGSCTAWRRGALEKLRGWRTAGEVTVSPSQDLLWRAQREGMKIVGSDRPTVLVLWSGFRKGSYTASYRPEDNVAWLEALTTTPRLVDEELARTSVATISKMASRPRRLHRRSAKRLVVRLCEMFGVHPMAPIIKIRFARKGGFINGIRAMNGLSSRDFQAQSRSSAS